MQVTNATGSTTLTAAITSTGATSISVASSANLAAGVVIQIGTELLQVTAVSGLTLTVTRGFNGSAAATQLINVTVTILAAIALGTILDATTAAAATSLAITFNQIRIDGNVLSGGGSTACTTDATWGDAVIYVPSLAAGPHRLQVLATGAIPWTEPCLYVGPIGATALNNAGLGLQIVGNVTGGISTTQVTTNLVYASTNTSILDGQILTFTSGVNANQSFVIDGCSNSSGSVRLSFATGWISNPSAGDAFIISNVATANSMTLGFNDLPGIGQIIDQSTGDGTPIVTSNGVVRSEAATLLFWAQQTLAGWPLVVTVSGVNLVMQTALVNGCPVWSGANSSGGETYTVSFEDPQWQLHYAGIVTGTQYGSTLLGAYGVGYSVGLPTSTPGTLSNPSVSSLPTPSALAAAIAAIPQTDVVAALITAGVLQYVSGSSGPLQLTPTAVATVSVPAPINVSTSDTIEIEEPHHHHDDD